MSFNVFQVPLFLFYDSAKGVFFHFGLTKLVILRRSQSFPMCIRGRHLRWVILNSLLQTSAVVCVYVCVCVCVCNSLRTVTVEPYHLSPLDKA